ncbi:MAG: LLM class flavin-dependent oxidoreductase [Alphaproteobacteria bacterium]|nr:LLM class flavin-dependent oxidoreductase [Alphaproteobacteria bacterium]
MRLGFFTQPVHPPQRNYREVLLEDRAAFLLADELGYCEGFVGEHFTDTAEPITSCVAFIASLAFEAKHITFGTGVVNLPSYHPVTVAGQVAMLDTLLDGRLIFGIGPGGLPSDVEVFGNLDLDRNAKMVECLEMILAVWNGEPPYDLKGRFYEGSTARTLFAEIGQGVCPKPLQLPHPPIVVTAVNPDSAGITAAAQRGWNSVSSNYVQAHWVATHGPRYLAGLRAAGQPETLAGWRIAKSIFVADDEATARRYAKSPDGPYGFYFRNIMAKLTRNGRPFLFKSRPDQRDEDVSLEHSLDTQVIAGTVDSVVDQLLAFREQVGPFGTLMYTGHDWADVALSRRSMQLMAEQVMPRLNAAIGETDAP